MVFIVRLPKKYDPLSKPDPERWLPLRERSTYRGKRGKRGKQTTVGKGTQGAMGSDQSATTTITTSTGAQKSMPASKTTAGGSASTQPKTQHHHQENRLEQKEKRNARNFQIFKDCHLFDGKHFLAIKKALILIAKFRIDIYYCLTIQHGKK